MGFRFAYGNSHSENGWPMVDAGSCRWATIPGTEVSLQIQEGWPLAILRAFAADYNAYIEPLRDRDSACWTATNSVGSSNHLSGTGMDLNWDGPDGRTFRLGISMGRAYPGEKARKLRELLDFYEDMVFCGGYWSIQDWMHFQMGGNTFQNNRTADFIARKIRADGFSTFRRGTRPLPGDPANVLARATGLSLSRATAILPQVVEGLKASDCTTPLRIAMWLAQVGHESDSFNATEEYAKNGRYAPYIGRTWIQITWDYNYRDFSRWCYDRGLVNSTTYFLDNPRLLAEQRWAGLGAAWYWTVERPQLNALSDAGDLLGATRAINGGTNNIADRNDRYKRARALGDELLALRSTEIPTPTIEELLMADTPYESWSIFADPNEGAKLTLADFIRAIDAREHERLVRDGALAGDPDEIDKLFRVAKGLGKYKDAKAIARAKSFIQELKNTNPEAYNAYVKSKGAA